LRVPFPEVLIAALLAAGFAAVGEAVLRRLSEGMAGASESMLVGMGVCAAVLFPLTLILAHRAVLAEAVLLALCLAWAIVRRIAGRSRAERSPRKPLDPTTRSILGAVAVVAAGFAALNFRYTYLWDGFLIWATKARLLSQFGGLTREWLLPGASYDLRHLEYPAVVPLYEALVAFLRGTFDYDRLKPVFFFLYLSLLVGTYAAARAALPARLAAVSTLLVALLPALSTKYAAGGYADMPQAAFVAGVVAAGMSGRKALPWLIGGLTTVKAEGTILAAVECAGVLLYWFLESPRAFLARILSARRGIAIVAAFFLLRVTYVHWIGAPEIVYHNGLGEALSRVPHVARLCVMHLLDPRQWGFFWIAFGAAAVVLLKRGSNRDKSLAAATALSLVLLAVPFLFTNWPVDLHVYQAYFRLLAQVAPAAATVIVLGYANCRPAVLHSAVLV